MVVRGEIRGGDTAGLAVESRLFENQRRPTLTEPQEAAAPERWSLAGQEELWETSIYDLRTWEVQNYDVNTVVLHVQCANLGQCDFCRLGSATLTTLHLSLTPILHHVFQAIFGKLIISISG